MSKAREIIEERLARGEISSEEFDALIAKLDAASPRTVGRPFTDPPIDYGLTSEEVHQAHRVEENKLPYLMLVAPIVVVFGYRFLSGDANTNLLASFKPYDGFISFAMIASAFYGIYKLVR